MPTAEDVRTELKQVFDPEIPVNIVDLGLIYDIAVEGEKAAIKMTLTSQACPEARSIPDTVKRRVVAMQGIDEASVDIVWEPTWGPHLISQEGRAILGIEDDDDDEL